MFKQASPVKFTVLDEQAMSLQLLVASFSYSPVCQYNFVLYLTQAIAAATAGGKCGSFRSNSVVVVAKGNITLCPQTELADCVTFSGFSFLLLFVIKLTDLW
jgi:hypothetical protein